ncbi:MAG: hypothetical protein M3O01_07385 [Pseudomonadota bacterium]|nr:hypothetical protein [Pseudomonadota bacterium]
MSIANVPGATRVASSTADRPTFDPAISRSGAGALGFRSAEAVDPPFRAATPPRFPWLSRLSQQLESAAKQKPPFEAAPVLGDIVNKAA